MLAATLPTLAAAALTGGALLGPSALESADPAPALGTSVSDPNHQNVCPGNRDHSERGRMHVQMMSENPGMARMHEQMMGENTEEDIP